MEEVCMFCLSLKFSVSPCLRGGWCVLHGHRYFYRVCQGRARTREIWRTPNKNSHSSLLVVLVAWRLGVENLGNLRQPPPRSANLARAHTRTWRTFTTPLPCHPRPQGSIVPG